MKLKNIFYHPVLTCKLVYSEFKNNFFKNIYNKRCQNFFKDKGALKYFEEGKKEEIKIDYIDLKRIYDLIIERKPKCTVEFGSGFSTIAIAIALKDLKAKHNFIGKLFSVEANKYWLENTEAKFNHELIEFVKFHYSETYISKFNDQIVTYHKNLPDVAPNFIYLDGPSPSDVDGEINGISFKSKNFKNRDETSFFKKNERRIVSADPLIYESTSPADFFILIDRRSSNYNFLEKNLKLNYDIKKDLSFGGTFTFEKKYQPYP